MPLCAGRLSMNEMSGKAAFCHRKPCNSTMYMAQLSLPGASFELTHMRFVYSHLTAADSNILLVYLIYHTCYSLNSFFPGTKSSSYSFFKLINISFSVSDFEVKAIDKAFASAQDLKLSTVLLKSELTPGGLWMVIKTLVLGPLFKLSCQLSNVT